MKIIELTYGCCATKGIELKGFESLSPTLKE